MVSGGVGILVVLSVWAYCVICGNTHLSVIHSLFSLLFSSFPVLSSPPLGWGPSKQGRVPPVASGLAVSPWFTSFSLSSPTLVMMNTEVGF